MTIIRIELTDQERIDSYIRAMSKPFPVRIDSLTGKLAYPPLPRKEAK